MGTCYVTGSDWRRKVSIYNREAELRQRLNSFLRDNFLLPEKDYFGSLSTEAIVGLKSVLSDINNILTLRVTMAFVQWISPRLNLDEATQEELERIVLEAKPNSNGFDVWLGYPVAFVGEVKCNIPVNGGAVYGSAQRHGIEKDVKSLLEGKKKANILPQQCQKFLIFPDLPQVRKANEHLIRTSGVCKGKLLEALEDTNLSRTDVIYLVYVSPLQEPPQSASNECLNPTSPSALRASGLAG